MIIDVEADELAMDIPHDPNLIVVDVRRETEFADGHVVNAQNLPLNEMNDVLNLAGFDDNQNLYIHCAGGYRSVIAASLLKKKEHIISGMFWVVGEKLKNKKILKHRKKQVY